MHTYLDYGEYEISLIVTNEFGLSSQPHIEYLELYDLEGDINNDNYVDVIDIVFIVDVILGNQIFESNQFILADCNIDNYVDVIDIILIVEQILSL